MDAVPVIGKGKNGRNILDPPPLSGCGTEQHRRVAGASLRPGQANTDPDANPHAVSLPTSNEDADSFPHGHVPSCSAHWHPRPLAYRYGNAATHAPSR